MNTDSFLSLLQFSDGLFPAGAYAHSFGLESCVQSGEVRDAEGVSEFLRSYLEFSAGPTDAVAAVCAWRAGKAGDLGECFALDERLDARKAASETRNASRQMGRQTLRVATHMMRQRLLVEFFAAAENDSTPAHHAVAFGLVGSAYDWPAEEMVSAYLFSSAAALVGASLRLMPLGQLAGQRILGGARPWIAQLASKIPDLREDDMWTFAPSLEIAAMRHATLDARLFRS
ncbi:MAG TPA: urease accessory protein UreF [Candidatus Acidoferrales bacterium]|jgi:urease accessory protein